MLEKTLKSPLDCKEIQPVSSKGDQSWVFIRRTDAEAETPILWPPDVKSWLIWKDPDAGKDWWREEKGMTEDEMAGWHHRLDGHGFGWTPGVGDRQGGLACCGSWGHKESDTTERLNWTELKVFLGGTVVKNLPANAGDSGNSGLIPGSGRSPGAGHGNPLRYSEFHAQRSLGGYSPQGHKQWDTPEHACTRAHTHTHTIALTLTFEKRNGTKLLIQLLP